MAQTPVHYISNIEALKAMKRLADIGLQAHSINVNPVDIKTSLAEMDGNQLLTISIDLDKIIKANS